MIGQTYVEKSYDFMKKLGGPVNIECREIDENWIWYYYCPNNMRKV